MKHIVDIDSDHEPKAMMNMLDLALTQYYEQQWHDKLQSKPLEAQVKIPLGLTSSLSFNSV